MPSKAKKPAKPPVTETPQDGGAWRPHVETEREFNPFASTGASGDARTLFDGDPKEPAIRNAAEGTAPLEGSKDLSDADSLQHVQAASIEAAQPVARRRARTTAGARRKPRAVKGRVVRRVARRARLATKRRAAAKRPKAKAAAKTRAAPRARRARPARATRGRRRSTGKRR